jgi:hypothetical protein
MEFPELDLGELGTQIDAALQDSDDESDAPEATAVEAATDDSPGEAQDPAGDDPVAADAGQDFEARYKERFEADYAQRSREDIGKIRSRLDQRISTQRNELDDLREELRIETVGRERLLQMLGEYDPEAAQREHGARDGVRARAADQRKLARYERERASETRRGFYQRTFGDAVSPDDPDLLDAFERGNERLERDLMIGRINRLGLVLDPAQGRYVIPSASAGWAPDTVPTVAPATAPAATPARDEQGRFVAQTPDPVAARVAATREREQARGAQIMTAGAATSAKPETNLDKATANLLRQLKGKGL